MLQLWYNQTQTSRNHRTDLRHLGHLDPWTLRPLDSWTHGRTPQAESKSRNSTTKPTLESNRHRFRSDPSFLDWNSVSENYEAFGKNPIPGVLCG
jgi:hypothetical protein